MGGDSALSQHLSVAEFTATQHRAWAEENRRLFDEAADVQRNARALLGPLFERARTLLGVPLHVNSGYRCGGLNQAVGGRPTSRHVLGLAIDVVPVGLDLHAAFQTLARAMKAGEFDADEIIIEMGWLHMQASLGTPRRLAMVTTDGVHFSSAA